MEVIIGLPGLIAAIYLFRRSPGRAFLNIYLPALFLLPNYYRWVLAGLPDPTFSEAAIIPIVTVVVVRHWRAYRFSIVDVLVLLYATIAAISEYQAKGFADAENLLFDILFTCLAPYFLAKFLIERDGLREEFAKRFVTLLAFLAVLAVYELRMGNHPLAVVWERLFPNKGGWGEQFRYGLARAKFTFGASILAATIFAVGCLLQFWLVKSRKWAPRERLLPWLPVKLRLPLAASTCVSLGLFFGILMPDSRGPLVGAIIGFVLVLIGQSRDIRKSFAIWTPILIVTAYIAISTLQSYASVSRSEAATGEQETAAYRHDLLIHYIGVVAEKPLLGWGLMNFPVIEGQSSIDNHFLLLALNSGLLGLATFCLVIVATFVRLFSRVMNPKLSLEDRRFVLVLASSIMAIVVSIASVFLGEQLFMVFFLLIGWADGCVVYPQSRQKAAVPKFEPSPATVSFRHVIT